MWWHAVPSGGNEPTNVVRAHVQENMFKGTNAKKSLYNYINVFSRCRDVHDHIGHMEYYLA